MLTSILIVVAVIIFSYLGFKKIKISQEQLKTSKKQIEISQKAQYSEQFLKSVELLASQDLGVLLVCLESLDDLSQQNKEEYKRVWEYLGNFLRPHKPLQAKAEKPYPVVEVIVEMLKGRNTDYEDFRLDLSYADLAVAKLYRVHLARANLYKVDISAADLEGANLEGANLEEANLEGANLEGANLRRANLHKANLVGADLEEAYLEKANLVRANLEGAYLEKANLVGVELHWANLVGANLDGANLRGAMLDGANLSEANLDGAKLEGALFGGTGEAQDLTNLTHKQLQGIYYDIESPIPKLPDGISEEDKPKGISRSEWSKEYRP